MRVYTVLQSRGKGGDFVIPSLVVIPIIVGVLAANMLITTLVPPLLIVPALYVKRVFYQGKAEWGAMLLRQIMKPQGRYTNADKDI